MRSLLQVLLAWVLVQACWFDLAGSDPAFIGNDDTSDSEDESLSKDKVLKELTSASNNESKGSLESMDGDPEFQVKVKGEKKPLCFNLDGQSDNVFRLVQDPKSGVIVNARVFVDQVTNRAYLGAILISKGKFRVLAKQHIVLVNDERYSWTQVNSTVFQGHRVLIGNNHVIVTIRRHQISLVIHRDFVDIPRSVEDLEIFESTSSEPGSIDYPYPTGRDDDDTDAGGDDADSDGYSYSEHDEQTGAIKPMIEPLGTSSEARNSAPSLSPWPGFFSWSTGGQNRHEPVEQDYSTRKTKPNRNRWSPHSESQYQPNTGDSRDSKTRKDWRSQDHDSSTLHKTSNTHGVSGTQHNRKSYQQSLNQRQQRKQERQRKKFMRNRQRVKYPSRNRAADGRRLGDGRLHPRKNYRSQRMGSSHRTVFLGFYILDGRDFSNRTHGLLGQFMYKSVTFTNYRFENGMFLGEFLVHGQPERNASAVLSLRKHPVLNTSRECWLLQNGGRHVIDGIFPDYLVPSIRYNALRELPPPAPL